MSLGRGRRFDVDLDLGVDLDFDSGLDREPGPRTYRALACLGVLVLTASYVSVLREVTAVVGGTRPLLAIVVTMVLAATVLKRAIDPRLAAVLATVVAAVGFAYYFTVAAIDVESVGSTVELLFWDAVRLATGTSLLRMMEAGTWTLGFAPGPVFLSWYFALRRRYGASTIVGGAALLFLVLTGDASVALSLAGTVGAVAAVGFGELERHGGSIREVDAIAVVLAVVVVCSLLVPLTSSGAFDGASHGVGQDGTLEASLTSADEESTIHGSITLSEEERFTVHSETETEAEPYWRVSVYDRFTGDQWIRTGTERGLEGTLDGPPGETETVEQTIVLADDFEVLPTAPQPVSVDGVDGDVLVDDHGQVQPAGSLSEGDAYTVESAVVNASPETLREAGTAYPEDVTDLYLQQPEGTSSAFDAKTREIVEEADAETPYDKARAIETYLRNSKEYSLNVTRPGGNVAEEFLLEMDEGYCVYFATTMVQMLRSEDVPARYVSGYRIGERVGEDEWVVRGQDAHSWVEVYFPDHGWVAFEPTPGDERDAAHDPDRNGAAFEGGDEADSTERSRADESTDAPPDPYYDSQYPYRLADAQDVTSFDDRGGEAIDPYAADDEPDGSGEGIRLAGVQTVGFGFAVLVVFVIGASWTNAVSRTTYGARLFAVACRLRLRPTTDVEVAYRYLETLLEERYRARRPTESSRQYLSALATAHPVDERVLEVQRAYERQKYGPGKGLDRDAVDDAVANVEALLWDAVPIVGRLRR